MSSSSPSSLSLSLPFSFFLYNGKKVYFYVLSSNYFKYSKTAANPVALLEEKGPVIWKNILLNIQKKLPTNCLFGEGAYHLSVFEICVENVFIAVSQSFLFFSFLFFPKKKGKKIIFIYWFCIYVVMPQKSHGIHFSSLLFIYFSSREPHESTKS